MDGGSLYTGQITSAGPQMAGLAGRIGVNPAVLGNPSALSIDSSEYLLIMLRRLVELLAAKAASLSALRRQKGRSAAEFAAGDVGNFWLLHAGLVGAGAGADQCAGEVEQGGVGGGVRVRGLGAVAEGGVAEVAQRSPGGSFIAAWNPLHQGRASTSPLGLRRCMGLN